MIGPGSDKNMSVLTDKYPIMALMAILDKMRDLIYDIDKGVCSGLVTHET